ncbi:bifunctional diguanylate cyclase/phosphodiesterase [Kineococcus glutinatus]|uniref:Diguanylate cyclase (GGDEF)-like protein n=1 Tax=Kineococcus glutinatus TaxID=1070872 RepID=A0ABP8VAN6_9ACTN
MTASSRGAGAPARTGGPQLAHPQERGRLPWFLAGLLPEGRLLPEAVWQRRHRTIVRLALLQALALVVLALGWGAGWWQALAAGVVVAAPALLARWCPWGRKGRAAAATTSLFAASAVLVHLAGGLTEAHFHFFVMVGVVALYQDWVPFGVGLGIVVAHHGVLGTLDPHGVYGHHGAVHHPWWWAGVHGGFVLAASVAHLASWRHNEQQGLHDPLTGLANRTLLEEELTRRLARSQPLSVLVVDVDDVRAVNDVRGHAAGDELLRAVAERLGSCVRRDDRVARLGGDEFAVAVGGDAASARRLAERFLTVLAEPLEVAGQRTRVHVGIGVADSAVTRVRSAQALLRDADLAVHLAKTAGRDRLVVFAEGMDEAAQDRASLAEDLADALALEQLELHYQATVQLDDGEVEGYEALLRWRHPVRGLVPPLDFVPLAESGGHIRAIGAWALQTATAQAAAWSHERGREVRVAVNVSAVQLADDDVVTAVRLALAASGLPAHQLTLEVTESVLAHDLQDVAARLQRLRALGVRIAIDDFGTGYSSLSYLRHLPVDTVKIDRSFVSELTGDDATTTLVAAIVALARNLGLDVIGEGVETAEQAEVLRGLRCGLVQGYLYARPLPAAEVPERVRDRAGVR